MTSRSLDRTFIFEVVPGVGVVLQSQPNQTESLRKNFGDKRSKIVKEAKGTDTCASPESEWRNDR